MGEPIPNRFAIEYAQEAARGRISHVRRVRLQVQIEKGARHRLTRARGGEANSMSRMHILLQAPIGPQKPHDEYASRETESETV